MWTNARHDLVKVPLRLVYIAEFRRFRPAAARPEDESGGLRERLERAAGALPAIRPPYTGAVTQHERETADNTRPCRTARTSCLHNACCP